MFSELIDWPIASERLKWEARHVLRDLPGGPHLLFRIRLTGAHFPERGAEAFVRVGRIRSRFVEIASDGLSLTAYFDQPPPSEGIVEMGYGHRVFLRCARPFDLGLGGRLQRALLPPGVRNLDVFAHLLD